MHLCCQSFITLVIKLRFDFQIYRIILLINQRNVNSNSLTNLHFTKYTFHRPYSSVKERWRDSRFYLTGLCHIPSCHSWQICWQQNNNFPSLFAYTRIIYLGILLFYIAVSSTLVYDDEYRVVYQCNFLLQ